MEKLWVTGAPAGQHGRLLIDRRPADNQFPSAQMFPAGDMAPYSRTA
jgi:hypothetical protein